MFFLLFFLTQCYNLHMLRESVFSVAEFLYYFYTYFLIDNVLFYCSRCSLQWPLSFAQCHVVSCHLLWPNSSQRQIEMEGRTLEHWTDYYFNIVRSLAQNQTHIHRRTLKGISWSSIVITRPVGDGAVLQTPSSLVDWVGRDVLKYL